MYLNFFCAPENLLLWYFFYTYEISQILLLCTWKVAAKKPRFLYILKKFEQKTAVNS